MYQPRLCCNRITVH